MEIINDNGIEKLVHEGKVAVLISVGYGAGWYTWANTENKQQMLFDPVLVQMLVEFKTKLRVLGGSESEAFPGRSEIVDTFWEDLERTAKQRYPDEYTGGAGDLQVYWVPRGTRFIINEYDGAEGIELLEDVSWEVA